jgi:phosphoglycolate phosphatase-like HAD superfamily hydrolase
VAKLFAATIGGDTLKARKPEPEPVLEAARRLGVPAGRAVMVGDSPMDMQAGKAAGALTCGVTYGYRSPEEVKRCGPDFLVERFADLAFFLRPD